MKLSNEFLEELDGIVRDTRFESKYFYFYNNLNEIIDSHFTEERLKQIKSTLEYCSLENDGALDPKIDRMSKFELLFEYSKLE